MLIVTGLFLLATLLVKSPSGRLNARKSFLTGIAQSLALVPGISRSGSTICAAIYQDVEPEKAADFSFLMLLPVVVGATIVKVVEASDLLAGADWIPLLLGTSVAFVSGVAAIKIVLDVVRRGRLAWFALYCFAVGAAGLVLI
jgi:undecaprenyl-diphosphatase